MKIVEVFIGVEMDEKRINSEDNVFFDMLLKKSLRKAFYVYVFNAKIMKFLKWFLIKIFKQ